MELDCNTNPIYSIESRAMMLVLVRIVLQHFAVAVARKMQERKDERLERSKDNV
jgi:hypothetical protein